MPLYETIIEKLRKSLNPLELQVIDESDKHVGHAGYRAGGQTHFSIIIVSNKFKNLSIIQRHRLIYEVLDTEMQENIHALRISASAPKEN